jgi:Flp pilus assembly pilin Flp
MKNIWMKFWADDSGATAIEYGLIAAGISLAIISVVNGHQAQHPLRLDQHVAAPKPVRINGWSARTRNV